MGDPMTEKKEKNTKQNKKPYAKPELKKVPLKPEEAVLGFCKMPTISGPLQGVCNSPTTCEMLGS
jgi:hypothetical protein